MGECVPILSYRLPIVIDTFPTGIFHSRYRVLLIHFSVRLNRSRPKNIVAGMVKGVSQPFPIIFIPMQSVYTVCTWAKQLCMRTVILSFIVNNSFLICLWYVSNIFFKDACWFVHLCVMKNKPRESSLHVYL